ncbi:MAG: S41 family peptidase [Alphaproteobacteria bacterium]|jgi:carboxyl-terminal processing protease|nr:S41 family peptidase [Alphaproteobacteria bacterium]
MRKFLSVVAVSTMLAVVPAAAIAAESDEETFRQLELFGDIFERVRAQYVDEAEDKDLIEAAINGMLHSLDPHSSYLNEESFRDMQVQTRGEFGGLGIEVTMEQGFVRVVSPIDETPAARAGLEAGDFITHLDGETVLGLSLSDAVDKMRGRVGSDIELTIRREGVESFDVTVTRDVVRIRSVRNRIEGKAGYIRVTTFNEQTMEGVESSMKKLKEELGDEMIGVVLDLRRNPGGLLDQAVKVSDAFLDRGEIVSTRGRESDDAQRFNAKKGDLAEGLPMVVLINRGSASASEIVAGALQDHKRAVIMGTESFGKGSVQTIMPIAGHGALRLTTAAYFTPSGRSIQKTGIAPDILVEQAQIQEAAATSGVRERDLRNARDNEGTEQPDSETEAVAETTAPQDYQLTRALDLLKGIATFNQRATN